MKTKENKFVLPVMIVLFGISLICSIYGLLYHITYDKDSGNPQHLKFYEDKLYYYNGSDLLGYFDCKNMPCDDAKTSIDDEYLNSYKGPEVIIPIINNELVFILSNDKIILYNLKSKGNIATFLSIKNYGVNLSNNTIIVKSEEGKYGLLNLNDVNYNIFPTYDFLGIRNKIVDDLLDASVLCVLENEKWFLVDDKGKKLSSEYSNPIIDYDDNYIFIKGKENIMIYDFDNNRIVSHISIKGYEIFDDFYILTNNDGYVYIYSKDFEELRNFGYYGGNFTYNVNNNIISVYDNDSKIGTYEVKTS